MKSRKRVKRKQLNKGRNSSWREFEKLVAQVERVLCPEGAIVKSPDMILDKITGQAREVDASIRYKVGSAEILITIECRERTSIQDTTWIEQLAAKQNNIGAAKTIAVTVNGFTKPAMEKARFFGIEVRKIERIDTDTIEKWTQFITKKYHYDILDYWIVFDRHKTDKKFAADQSTGFIPKNEEEPFRELFEKYLQVEVDKIPLEELPDGDTIKTYSMQVDFTEDFFVQFPDGKVFVKKLDIKFVLLMEEEIAGRAISNFTYSGENVKFLEGNEYELISDKGTREILTIYSDLNAGIKKFTIERVE